MERDHAGFQNKRREGLAGAAECLPQAAPFLGSQFCFIKLEVSLCGCTRMARARVPDFARSGSALSKLGIKDARSFGLYWNRLLSLSLVTLGGSFNSVARVSFRIVTCSLFVGGGLLALCLLSHSALGDAGRQSSTIKNE